MDLRLSYNDKKNKVIFELLESEFMLGYEIPKGYVTDFATVPRFLWSVLPPIGRHNKAALLHDYLYDNRIGTRKKADKLFLKQMEIDKVSFFSRWAMYLGVRIFAKSWWIK